MATAMAAISPKEELNPFEIAKQQFDRAADYLELEESLRNVLRSAKRQLIVSIPVRMDGGETKVFEGYRVQHNIARGPAKGGIRYHPNVTLDDLEVRHRQHPLRRRQGRRGLRSKEFVEERTRTAHPTLCFRDCSDHRARSGYSGA